jgi:hypothetical protein
MKRCHACQHELELKTPPGRRDTCPYCSADLHVCFNCRHYSPTASQQCRIPDIEPVKDKKQANFCDEFFFRDIMPQTPQSGPEAIKKKWEDLFRNI